MPVYDYKCREHGLFHTLATMEDAAKPAECPTCKALSPRVIVLPSYSFTKICISRQYYGIERMIMVQSILVLLLVLYTLKYQNKLIKLS